MADREMASFEHLRTIRNDTKNLVSHFPKTGRSFANKTVPTISLQPLLAAAFLVIKGVVAME